jgi:hypothetical protein
MKLNWLSNVKNVQSMSISVANLVIILLGEENCNINAKEIFLDSRSKVTSKVSTIYS